MKKKKIGNDKFYICQHAAMRHLAFPFPSACYSKTAAFWVFRVQDRTGGLYWTHNAVSGVES